MPTAVLIWVWSCAYLNCAGWTLSGLHQLNARGYAVALLLWLGGLFVWKLKSSAPVFPAAAGKKIRRRFRKPFPRAFLILAAMAFLGGALYAPNNYDALAYRIPRILHWLAADQWHWIHTVFPRLNQRCCGIEWISAPLIALLKTDRLLFLINVVSFLFLPGLVFSVFIRIGMRARVAWHWMWLVPTGYCFLLQAASIGNDLFGSVFVLAAMDFALRTKASGAARDFFAAVIAAALMTSAKPSNLPLLLPWTLAMLPSAFLILRWPWRAAMVGVIALAASFAPTAVLNWHYCGDWTGLKVETGYNQPSPIFLTGANTVLISVQNLAPPVFPINERWHAFVTNSLPDALSEQITRNLETGDKTYDLPQLQIEENAGLGFGVTGLMVISLIAARRGRAKTLPACEAGLPPGSRWQKIVRWSPFFSLLVLMSHSWVAALGREITPYYALLLPVFLMRPGQAWLVHQRWWRRSAGLVFVVAAGLLVLSPARPLFPVRWLLNFAFVPARAVAVYQVYQNRNDAFAPVRTVLPADLKVLGLFTYDDPETSLWHPFGTVRLEHICPADTLADLQQRHISYVLLNEAGFQTWFKISADEWRQRMKAQMAGKVTLNLRAFTGPVEWVVFKLPPVTAGSPNQPGSG